MSELVDFAEVTFFRFPTWYLNKYLYFTYALNSTQLVSQFSITFVPRELPSHTRLGSTKVIAIAIAAPRDGRMSREGGPRGRATFPVSVWRMETGTGSASSRCTSQRRDTMRLAAPRYAAQNRLPLQVSSSRRVASRCQLTLRRYRVGKRNRGVIKIQVIRKVSI